MTAKTLFPALVGSALLAASMASAADAKSAKASGKPGGEKITFEDHVLPIFRDNCLKCHNPDKQKGDLDLTTYSATIKGGGSGSGVSAGDADGSKLMKCITHAEEPFMPPNSPKMDDKVIALIRKWIDGGLLETSGSKAVAANKPKMDFTLKGAAIGKPEGPPPMPGKLALDPVVTPRRGTALSAFAASPWAPVVAFGGPKQIIFYNTDDLEFIGVLPYPEGFADDLKFSRNGKLVLVGGGRGAKEGGVVVWDIAKAERVITIGDQYDSVLAADISADQSMIALGGPDRLVKIYDTKDGSLDHKIKKHTDWVTALEFSPNGKYLVTGDRAGGLMLWEASSGQEMFTLNGHRGAITSVNWRDDSGVVISASEDGSVKLWNPTDGQMIKSFSPHGPGVLCARYGHDGRIITCGRDNRVKVWNTSASDSQMMTFSGELPNRVALTHDGARAIGGDYDGRVMVWDVKTGNQIGELESTPPTLTGRVERDAKRITELQADADKAAAEQARLEAEAKVAQSALEKSKAAAKQADSDIAAKTTEIKKLEADLAKNAGDDAIKKDLASARDAVKKAQAELKRLNGTEIVARTKDMDAANKKAADAKIVVEKAIAKVASAKSSLAKWKAAQQSVQGAAKVAAK